MSELLLTVDGHSMAFRAFYALPPEMVARDGTPTNAVYGFASMLSKVIDQHNPTHIAVAFDTAAPTFRVERDQGYKAQRDETPKLFIPQIGLIIEMLEAMNIPVCMQDGVEADDIIATFAHKAKKQDMDILCVTGDRDYFQLVNDPCVKVMYVRRGVSDTIIYDEAGIVERTGITPTQYVDYAAMRGDPSDNLPGVPGIGEKTAAKLLIQYSDLEGIYEHLEDLPPKQKQNLIDSEERVYLNRELMTLVHDVKELPTVPELKRTKGNAQEITELCDRLQFRAMAKKLLDASLLSDSNSQTKSVNNSKSATETKKQSVCDTEVLAKLEVLSQVELTSKIENAKAPIALYLEPHAPQAHVTGEIKFPYEILLDTGKTLGKTTFNNVKELTNALCEVVKNAPDVIGYDTKTWGSVFALCELDQPKCIDLNVMAALDDASRGKKTLEQTCASYLGVAPMQAATQLGLEGMQSDNEPQNFESIKIAYLRELHEELLSRLQSKNLEELYSEIEQPLTSVIAGIETAGVFVDQKRLAVISKDIHERCEKYQNEILSHAGEPINVNSTQQLRRVLFDQLGLTPIKKTKTGPSTDAETLHALRGDHPIIEAILRYREVEKLRSTYIDALGPLIAPDGRIHATFNQALTSTGRISSEAPNLQNIPIRTEEGKNLRTMFVAPKGTVLCSIDYSQIELRILAHLSKEQALIEAFKRGDDVHKITAAKVFKVAEKDVTYDQRSFAKVVNYGIAYGMESYGLATRAGIDPGEAKEILETYWKTFSSMHAYLDSVVVQAKKKGYTETLFGRRRYFPELSSPIGRVKIAGARAATNAPVQGTAADIFKLAMVNVSNVIKDQDLPASMVLTVHDELVFEIQEARAVEISKIIAKTMENVVDLDVPLVADVGIGKNWAEAK